jgi:hypothetical protein
MVLMPINYSGASRRWGGRYVGGNKQSPGPLPVGKDHPANKKPDLKDGAIYFFDDSYWRVLTGRDSGRMYAKRLDIWQEGEKWKFHWDYAPGKISLLKPEHELDSEQAKIFGDAYSSCIKCFRPLSREESKRRGYGPDCALNNGWPYDQNAD